MTKTIMTSAVAVMVVTLLASTFGFWIKSVTTEEPNWNRLNTISITGEASSDVKVQFVKIKATVTIKDPTSPAPAKITSDETVKSIISLCEHYGIARSDLDGSKVYVGPNEEYNYDTQRREQHGYVAIRTLSIRLNDLEKLDAILTSLVAENSVTVDGLDYGSDDSETAYNEAIKQAVDIARRRAETLAAFAGTRIVRVSDIDDIGWADYMEAELGYATGQNKPKDGSSFTKNAITVKAKVRVSFETAQSSTNDVQR